MKPVSALFSILFLFTLLTFFPQTSEAHRLNVFAWLEGDQVVVECNFGRNHPAANAAVRIVDSDTGKIILQGKASNNGVFSFPVPKVVQDGHGLTVEVNAGQGHYGDWKMDASELYAAASLTAGFDQAAIDAREKGLVPGQKTPGANQSAGSYQIPSSQALSGEAQTPEATSATPAAQAPNIPMPNTAVNHDEMRGIIEEAMARQLRSVHHAIANQNSGPTLVNVIGGLGWIVGIVGIYLYSRSRREIAKKSGTSE